MKKKRKKTNGNDTPVFQHLWVGQFLSVCMQQKKKRKGEKDILSEPIHWLDAAASSTAAVSYIGEGGWCQQLLNGVEGGRTAGGGGVGTGQQKKG